MAPLATAYSGPPKLTVVRAFTEWRVDVPMLVLILLLAAWYLLSARKVRRGGGQWGSGRAFAFIVLGLGFWAIATMVEPTGSGDAFRSGFLAATAWGLPSERAIQLGNLMAVHSLEVVGPQEYDLTSAALADRAKHAYGEEAAADIAAHLPA